MKIIWRACSVLKTWRNSMAKAGRLPDFRKMYPEASEEIISVLKETERKIQYQEYDLKAEQAVLDRKTGRVSILPGREDSLDRMMGCSRTEGNRILRRKYVADFNMKNCTERSDSWKNGNNT